LYVSDGSCACAWIFVQWQKDKSCHVTVETEIEAVMVVVDATGTEVAEAMVVEVAVEAADMAEAVVAADMVAQHINLLVHEFELLAFR